MLCAALLLSWAVASQWVGRAPFPLFPQQGAQGVSRVLAGLQDGRGRLDRSTGTLDTWPAEPPPPGWS